MKGWLKNPKVVFNILVITGLGFLLYKLWEADYLFWPEIYSKSQFIFSAVLVTLGFISNSLQWKVILANRGYKISYLDSICSFGLSIFGKYIPGKIWVHVGKGAYINRKYGYSLTKLSEISIYSQLITLIVGLSIGLVVFIYLKWYNIYLVATLLTIVCFFSIIVIPFFRSFTKNIYKSIFKKSLNFEGFSIKSFFQVLPIYVLTLSLFSFGFYFLTLTLTEIDLETGFSLGFIFPLAMSIGVLAIFLPGGVGVREFFIVQLLVEYLITEQYATTISLFSRFWFLFGETSIFVIALVLQFSNSSGAIVEKNIKST